MPTIFIYTLGPVQDFIATAKRCRDLWFGSWLLSELSKAAARAVADHPGVGPGALVFPCVDDASALEPASPMSVANKIVALVPDGVDLDDLAADCHAQILARLRDLQDVALRTLGPDAYAHVLRGLADLQVDDLIEALWVSVDCMGNYQAARRAAERLLSSAKHTRLWQARPWPPAHTPKSSLDGVRESVIDERVYREPAARRAPLQRSLALDEGERLCGVGMLKRHGLRGKQTDEHRFFSTPHLAALPLLARMRDLESEAKARVQVLWTGYLAVLRAEKADLTETVPSRCPHPILGRHDGQLLFESRVIERFEHLEHADRHLALAAALPALRKLLAELGPSTTPLPYIAILVADGDLMGDAIDRQPDANHHRQLSRALDSFSQGARELVSKHEGELIYAGGDDVLAFVPLHRAVACARALRDRFVAALRPFGDGQTSPTLSVGIGVCHFMEPMTRSLDVARAAERLAKQGRDALAIIVDKRSGAAVTAHGKWDEIDASLATLVKLHLDDEIPDKLAHDLTALQQLQHGAPAEQRDTLAEIAAYELRRILGAKRRQHGNDPLSPTTRGHLVGRPEPHNDGHLDPSAALAAGLDPRLAGRLFVAQILARAHETATPTEPRP